jgi:hypothetical protein
MRKGGIPNWEDIMKKSEIKNKIRNTDEWKGLRYKVYDLQNGICPFCNGKLFKGYNLHHKDDRIENYGDFSDMDNFVALHRGCHKIIEELHRKKNLPLELKAIIDKYFV